MDKKTFQYNGIFYVAESPLSETVIECTSVYGEKFSACYRFSSCWMKTAFVKSVGEIPAETQYLLAKTEKGYTLYFLLCDGSARASLFSENGRLYCRVETGDENVPLGKFRYMYSLECENPFTGMECAYREMREELGSFILKKDKKQPDFIDYLGYCTYNAFSSEVTHDNVLSVEKAFCQHGITLGFIIADEGWMTANDGKLASFTADEKKFPYGLATTVAECKNKYGLKKFLCWHTYNGYWKGMDGDAFPLYYIKEESFRFPARLGTATDRQDFAATAGDDFYPMNIVYQHSGICYKEISRIYKDFYYALKEQGVDGSKIDAITWVEAFSADKGGRVKTMQSLLRAIEGASEEVFDGNHINCSSCSNDFFMNLGTGALVRTSCDYMPDKPLTHGAHIIDNAFVGFWVQPIVVADWDMFESGSEWGSYHAAARAISGGPVYCTDKPEKADFSLLGKLSTKDGRVLRCKDNATPTAACLFGTPVGEPFRICNRTEYGYVLAAFGNVSGETQVNISLSEIHDVEAGRYAVYSSLRGFVGVRSETESVSCKLGARQAEIFTMVKIRDGIAVIGMTEKLNPSAYIQAISFSENELSVTVEEKGKVGIYTDEKGYKENLEDCAFVIKKE